MLDLEKGSMVEADHVVGDMIGAGEKGRYRHAQPAHGYAHLQSIGASRPRRDRQTTL